MCLGNRRNVKFKLRKYRVLHVLEIEAMRWQILDTFFFLNNQ